MVRLSSKKAKRCPAVDVDDRPCSLPAGHVELHVGLCSTCGSHAWPRPEEMGERGDHAQAILMDAERALTNA